VHVARLADGVRATGGSAGKSVSDRIAWRRAEEAYCRGRRHEVCFGTVHDRFRGLAVHDSMRALTTHVRVDS
jgi:hypothetical protein